MSEVHTSRSGVIPNIFAGAFGAFLTAIIDSFTNGKFEYWSFILTKN